MPLLIRTIKTAAVLAVLLFEGFATPSAGEHGKGAGTVDEAEVGKEKGWAACKQLFGYSKLRENFEIEEAMLGYVNRMDESLFVQLRTTSSTGLNAAWWWNPIVDGKPQYSWSDFQSCFKQAQEIVARHAWLLDWLETSPGRKLELHAFGCEPGSDDFELDFAVRPLWADAGLRGQPKFEIFARRGNSQWAQIFMAPSEERALVAYTMQPDADATHWLDSVEISFHPRCQGIEKNARYLTVLPNGEREFRVYSNCEP